MATHIEENRPATDLLSDQVEANANDAFHRIKPITEVMVPIAGAQEPPGYLTRALGQLGQQSRAPLVRPFSVILSVNYPEIEDPSYTLRVKENVNAIKAFQESPEGRSLPLSFFEQAYPVNTSIGRIRKDLGAIGLWHMDMAYGDESIPEDANIFISDIDTWSYSRRCMPLLQRKLEEGYSWAAANKQYLTSDGRYPNLDRVIGALNLAHRLHPYASYDCHSMYSVRTYLEGEGFSELDTVRETHRMRERAEKAMGDRFVNPLPRQVPGAVAISYPRRPFEKFRQGIFSYDFWNEGEFGMQDSYREGRPVSPQEDISDETARRFIGERVANIRGDVRDTIIKEYLAGFKDEKSKDMAYPEIRRKVDRRLLRILTFADAQLDLRLRDISILDGIV